ncbi:diacylglycerol/lipid kinase family protein [Nannocystaceae bacterium ST9]
MTPSRALLLMTPPTVDRLGPARHEFDREVARAFPSSERLTTDDPGSLRRLLHDYEPDVIIAAGGDGTANLALQAMRERDALALLPLGTANDLARFLGVRRNPGHLGSFVLRSACRIDVVRVDDQRFCTTGGLGLPAEIAHRVNQLRNEGRGGWIDDLGVSLYPVIGAQCCLRTLPLHRLDVEWEDPGTGEWRRTSVQSHGLFVTNQSTFARTLQVVRDAHNSDGLFELCILLPRGRVPLLRLLAAIVQRTPSTRDLRIIRTRRATITADHEVRFYGDGEILVKSSRFELAIEPAALRLLS